MGKMAFSLAILILMLGAVHVGLARDENEDAFPVKLYVDIQGEIVSIDEESGTITLDNGFK